MTENSESRLLWCHVHVDLETGNARAKYRFADAEIDGSVSYADENLTDWSDRDVARLFADLIGIDQDTEDFKAINVMWE